MRTTITELVLGVIFVLGVPSPGRGQSLPPAVWGGSVEIQNCLPSLIGLNCQPPLFQSVTGPGITNESDFIENATINGTNSPPAILALARVPQGDAAGYTSSFATSSGALSYQLDISSSLSGTVRIVVTGGGYVLSTSGGNKTLSDISLSVGTGSSSSYAVDISASSTNDVATGTGAGLDLDPTTGHFSYSDTLLLTTNTNYTVQIEADALAGNAPGYSSLQEGRSYIDPYFYIDPSFPDAQQYSILTSPGIGNIAPEPTTLILLLAGLAGIGVVKFFLSGVKVAPKVKIQSLP